MYLTVPPQPDCISTWREAVRAVDLEPSHQAHNVIMAVKNPVIKNQLGDLRIAAVDDFLRLYAKPVQTVANTIFPASLYRRHGAPDFFQVFHETVLPRVRNVQKGERWSGYYFERMTHWPNAPMDNPLWDVVQRLRDPKVRAKNKFEISVFDPARDVDRSPYGGQCLSHLSFKLLSGAPDALALTAVYRNHYYIEKLLGNLIGLGQLMGFVAAEAELAIGPLVVLSSHATIDLPRTKEAATTRADVAKLLASVDGVQP